MVSSKNYLPKSSAHNRSFTSAIARPSRRDFIRTFAAAGFAASFGGALAPQRLEANNGLRSINWKEILARFGDSVVIPGERDASGKDMIVGRTMNEIYKLYLQQQEDWCAVEAANCEGEVDHARRDNRVLVPGDYLLSVPLEGGGDSINLPLNGYATTQNIADFSRYANDILGLSGQYSGLQMVDENGDSRPLLLSKQGVPVFFSAEELLFIYAHYRMNKVTAEEIKFAGTVLDYGGVNSAAQARALRYKRIGNVRAAGMNNLQTALRVMFNHHRFINEINYQSIDSTAPFDNYDSMTEYWNEDGYWKGGRKISAEQSQARIRAMLAKDPEPLGKAGRSILKWWSSPKYPVPVMKDSQGNEISAENPIDLANQLYPNDPLKAMMALGNIQLKSVFDYYLYGLNGGAEKRIALQTTKNSDESKSARWMNMNVKRPRDFLIEESSTTTIAQK